MHCFSDFPCQDLTFKGIMKDLAEHIVAFDLADSRSSNIFWKVFQLLKVYFVSFNCLFATLFRLRAKSFFG